MQGNTKNVIKRAVDLCMTVLLLCLMAYQVTGEVLHEWIGVGMTLLVIFHQILNIKWYKATFKGKYNAYRILSLVINIALIAAFGLTAFCGMSMSGHAVPFLYGMTKVSFARRMHLSMSYWAFVLIGLHLGLHIPVIFAKFKMPNKLKIAVSVVSFSLAGVGLLLFLNSKTTDYLFFKVPFAFLDYEKAGAQVFLENILMLLFWAFIGTQVAVICKNAQKKKEENQNPLLPVVLILAAIVIGAGFYLMSNEKRNTDFGGTSWNPSPSRQTVESSEVKDQ